MHIACNSDIRIPRVFILPVTDTISAVAIPSPSPSRAAKTPFQPFGADGFTFGDLVDMLNPLHHIPIIGAIYRKITGDEIAPAARIAGGALFAGPIGAVWSVVSVAIERITGKAPGEHAFAAFDKEPKPKQLDPMLKPERPIAVTAREPVRVKREGAATPMVLRDRAALDNPVVSETQVLPQAELVLPSKPISVLAPLPGTEVSEQGTALLDDWMAHAGEIGQTLAASRQQMIVQRFSAAVRAGSSLVDLRGNVMQPVLAAVTANAAYSGVDAYLSRDDKPKPVMPGIDIAA